MAGQTDSEFRALAITETSRNLQYNFQSSPVPFECPDTILSPPLSSSMPHAVRLESNSRVVTPIPCQPRVSTPYPVIDSVTSGQDWSGLSPENRLFPSSWGFESTVHIGQQFQGSMLSMATSNSHSVHHYAFPQSWHHAVTSPPNFSGYSLHNSDLWYLGDSSMIEGFGSVDEGNDVIEQDSKVTSSTELASPWKPDLVLPPVSELLNTSHGNMKCERVSPMEATLADVKYQPNMQPHGVSVKPERAITSGACNGKEARTQTPWKLKNPKSTPVVQGQLRRKGKPRRLADPLVYLQQKTVQREREKAIRDKIKYLSSILPWTHMKNNRPSRREILESAISRIMQLQEDIREAYLQKGLKTEDLKAALQGNMMFNLDNSCCGVTGEENDLALISDDSSSLASTPDLVVDESLPVSSASPISELSSQGSEEPEVFVQSWKPEEKTNHVKRPMNAFMWFSQENRPLFKQLYPGRDNRKISGLLAEEWKSLMPEQKEPFKKKAREQMRLTKESHPDYKYCEANKKTGVVLTANSSKQAGLDQGYRVGSHNLRQRSWFRKVGKGLEQAPNKIKCQEDNKPTIKANNLPGKTYEMPSSFEGKFTPKVVAPSVSLNQDNSHSLVKQILQSSCHHQAQQSAEWNSTTFDDWVQCENCKKWQMLPDDTDPASLPDKWYCCVNADHLV